MWSVNVLYEYFTDALMNFCMNSKKTSKYFVEDQCNHVTEKSFQVKTVCLLKFWKEIKQHLCKKQT